MTTTISRFRAWVAKPANWPLRGKILAICVGAAVVIALVGVFIVAAIPNTDHGRILSRKYHEAYDVYVAEVKSCYSYDSNGQCTGSSTIPAHWDHYPETWTVRVQDEKDEQETLEVSEGVFQGCVEGMWYPGHGVACTQEESTP